MPSFRRPARLVALVTLATGLAAAALPPAARAADPVMADGPHAPAGRQVAAPRTTHTAGVVVHDVDLGDAVIGPRARPNAFRAPVRGLLVTPAKPAVHAPLVVFSHLRSPGCTDDSSAYPCPRGAAEVRYDRGMSYLAEALAARGYAVLVPDLAPVWVGQHLDGDYDQRAAWLTVTGRLRDEVVRASSGQRTVFGAGMAGMVDGRRTTLVVHSRSAEVMTTAVAAWARSSTPIASVMAYGGYLTPPDGDDDPFRPPVPPQVPFLAVDGTADRDVEYSTPTWLAEHVGQRRSAPALGVLLPGFGHDAVNRALSSRGIDDRPEQAGLPDARAHERMLVSVTTQWLEQTIRHRPGTMPLRSASVLPATLAGQPARWLVVPAGRRAVWLAGTSPAPTTTSARAVPVCRPWPAMDPTPHRRRCAEPDAGVLWLNSTVTRVRLGDGTGARFPVALAHPGRLEVDLTPSGDRADSRATTPLRIAVVLADGRRVVLPVDARSAALRNLATADANGEYTVATLRIALPDAVRRGRVTAVHLLGGPTGGTVDVRAVSLSR